MEGGRSDDGGCRHRCSEENEHETHCEQRCFHLSWPNWRGWLVAVASRVSRNPDGGLINPTQRGGCIHSCPDASSLQYQVLLFFH